MGNLDFSNEPGFSWYCVLLLISGIAMLGMTGVSAASRGSRVANMIFGLGFTCYALYLIFMFDGGHYFMFFKAFILPVLLIVGAVKSIAEKRQVATRQPYAPPVMDYGPPPAFPQQQPAPQWDQPQPQGQQPVPPPV